MPRSALTLTTLLLLGAGGLYFAIRPSHQASLSDDDRAERLRRENPKQTSLAGAAEHAGPPTTMIEETPPVKEDGELKAPEVAEKAAPIRRGRGASIAGRVLGFDGEPVPTGTIMAENATESMSTSILPGGEFRVEWLAERTLMDLKVQVSDPIARWHAWKRVTGVIVGTEDLVLRFDRGVALEGILVDAGGEPVTHGFVVAETVGDGGGGAGGEVHGDGRFKIEGLRPGAHVIRGQAGRLLGAALNVEAPSRDLRLVLPSLVKFSGRLVGAGDLSDFRVAVSPSVAGGARTNPDGAFTLALPGDGQFHLVASKPGDDRYAVRDLARHGDADVELALQVGLAIEGVVEMPLRTTLPEGTLVIASAIGGPVKVDVLVAEDGSFRVRGLPPGRYRLTCHRPGGIHRTMIEAEAGTKGHRLSFPRT